MAKICSCCKKENPLSSHRCFIFGKGRLVNDKPLPSSISEKLFNRLIIEFPDFADDMRQSDVRPTRIYDRCAWNWSYWPVSHISIGSAWTMKECVKEQKWEIYQARGCYDIEIILPIKSG